MSAAAGRANGSRAGVPPAGGACGSAGPGRCGPADRRRTRRLRRAFVLLALVASACTSRPDRPAPPPSPVPEPAAEVPAVPDETVLDDRFCSGLSAAVDASGKAFQALRLQSAGDGRWRARSLDAELGSCLVEGAGVLTATYTCAPSAAAHGDPGSVEAAYRRIEGRIDRCLARPSWYPRRWAKAPQVRLAGGERQILWRDQAAWPRPALRLKIEEDYGRPGGWTLRFTGYTMR